MFQINSITSWVDGSFVYSTKEAWVNAMRSFKNGTLASRHLRRAFRRHTALPEPNVNESAVNSSTTDNSAPANEDMEEVVEEVDAATYEGEFPLKNTARVPLFNMPSPHQLTHMSPERMLGKLKETPRY